jgi:hypothetical protein
MLEKVCSNSLVGVLINSSDKSDTSRLTIYTGKTNLRNSALYLLDFTSGQNKVSASKTQTLVFFLFWATINSTHHFTH